MNKGDRVKVVIVGGGGSLGEGKYVGPCGTVAGRLHEVEFDGWFGRFPESWLTVVVPACPWTRVGTVVACKTAYEEFDDLYRLNYHGNWYSISEGGPVDYATRIAPRNPRELVPVETIVPLNGQNGWAWIDASQSHVIHTVYGNKKAIEALKDRLNVVAT